MLYIDPLDFSKAVNIDTDQMAALEDMIGQAAKGWRLGDEVAPPAPQAAALVPIGDISPEVVSEAVILF